jgi:predicted nuclease with TOPRIM domain
MKAEGERLSLQNQLDGMVEMVKKEQSKKVEYITPPDVEDELETLRLENSRIAAALEEAKKPQSPVALPEPKVERVEVEVIKEVVPPAIQAKIREQENLICELQRREVGNPKLEEKRDALLREIQQLREESNQARSEKGLIDGFDFLQTASSVTEKIVDMAGRGTLTVEQLTEAERIFKGMLVAANNGIQAIRDIQGVTKEGGGLRVVR